MNVGTINTSFEERIGNLVLEYAQTPAPIPLAPSLSLRRDLSIDSLSLVALVLRFGDELAVDLLSLGLDLSRLDTVSDLLELGRSLSEKGETHVERAATSGQ
jgi:acyl carrier protein